VLFLALTTVLASGGGERALDTVVLTDGERLEGHVLYEGPAALTLRVGSRERELPLESVADVRSVARSLRLLLDQYAFVDGTDARQMLDLARFSRARELDGLAEVFALRALEIAEDDATAHEFLGHIKRGKSWYVRDGNHSVRYEDLPELRGDWKGAWEIHTPHYDVRTNLSLREALDAAMDLELFYREFYDRFGKELELREVVLRMPTQIHADSGSFPELAGDRTAYFDPARMTTYVNAERGYMRNLIFHEACHQLLYATAVSPEHSSRARGCLPAWLDEGLASWFEMVQTGPAGHAVFEDRRQSAHYMTVHQTATKPYDLSRVLTFGAEDFHASSRVDLKYAQSYTLVEFFMRGDFYRHRESFFAVLRGAYAGKCTSSDVRGAMVVGADEFEAAWNAYVGR